MKKISRQNLWTAALLAAALGALDFYAAWDCASVQARGEAALIAAHLSYAAGQQDEMELIDWGRSLSASFPGLALKASLNGQDLLRLGDLSQIPAHAGPGEGFQFPDGWFLRRSWPPMGMPDRRLELDLRLPLGPNPWLFALGNALAVWWAAAWFIRKFSTASGTADLAPLPLGSTPPQTPLDPVEAVLGIDEAYRLGSVSPRAAHLLQKDRENLLGRHLLDLAPQPGLLEIMRAGRPETLPDAFHPPLSLTATVTPEKGGWHIRLEPFPNGQKR